MKVHEKSKKKQAKMIKNKTGKIVFQKKVNFELLNVGKNQMLVLEQARMDNSWPRCMKNYLQRKKS